MPITTQQALQSSATITQSILDTILKNALLSLPKTIMKYYPNCPVHFSSKQATAYSNFHKHKTFFGHAIMNDYDYEPTLIGCVIADKDGEIFFSGSDDKYVQ